jgi:hypothetical protein
LSFIGVFQTGYREGITAGKESALQEGFDDGFAHVGAPLGHELGVLRGIASALLSFLPMNSSHRPEQEAMIIEARDIASQLANIRFVDIAPRDLEAEEHARQHMETDDSELEMDEEVAEKRKMEELEDMLAQLTAGTNTGQNRSGRPTAEDTRLLKARLQVLTQALGLSINLS